VLDQSTAAVLDGTPYAAFGHGTMVMGVIPPGGSDRETLALGVSIRMGQLRSPTLLRAIYYARAERRPTLINMSFDITTASTELQKRPRLQRSRAA